MNWRSAMRWARARALSCRVVVNPDGTRVSPDHRHRVSGVRYRVPGPWTYEIECTDQPSRFRPTR